MKVIFEGNLKFSFPLSYSAIKYDESIIYKKKMNKISYTRAVDIIYILDNNVDLIEIKDYRVPSTLPSKKKWGDSELISYPDQIAWKVRDTLSALVVGKITESQELLQFTNLLFKENSCKIRFIFFFEDFTRSKLHHYKSRISQYFQALQQKLKPMGIKVFAFDRNTKLPQFEWNVESLPFRQSS